MQSWKAVLFLSIILPVSLFTAFRLTGTFPEPAKISEVITAAGVAWNMTRPSRTANLNVTTTNFYSDGNLKQTMSVFAAVYSENYPEYPAWNSDYLTLRVRGGANVSDGFICSVKVIFSQIDEKAVVEINMNSEAIELNGCRKDNVRIFGDHTQTAYFEATAVDQARDCSLGALVAWVFLDDKTADHGIVATFETTYFNGTVYKQINIPIFSEVIAG
jgi:hypothetical protein